MDGKIWYTKVQMEAKSANMSSYKNEDINP